MYLSQATLTTTYGLLTWVDMYVCLHKYASIQLGPHWFLGMGAGETISKQLFRHVQGHLAEKDTSQGAG